MESKEKIKINNIDTSNGPQISQLADLYANVFAGPPWNEIARCTNTQAFYGAENQPGSACPDCSIPLEEAYPQESTIKYILGELGKSNPIGLLATIDTKLAGFSWGYQTDRDSLAESKWQTGKMKQVVKDLLTSRGVNNKLFYGSETGVDPKFQGKGLGKQLVNDRLKQVEESNANFMLIRTNVSSPMYGICQNLAQFKQILGPVAKKGLVSRKFKKTDEIINTLDSENSERVLFLYNKTSYQNSQPDLSMIIRRGY